MNLPEKIQNGWDRLREIIKEETSLDGTTLFAVGLITESLQALSDARDEVEQYGKLLNNIHGFMDRLEVPMGDADRRVVMYIEKLNDLERVRGEG